MLSDLNIAIAAVSAIILFLFGLEHFTKEMNHIAGDKLRSFFATTTKNPIVGLLLGALITSVIQSSSGTTVLAVSLVNAGVMSFKNSLGIIFGANVGTTVTAQLIAFKLTKFAPIFIIIGFALSMVRTRYSIIGKSIFYFGFVFFTLNLISSVLDPLQSDPRIIKYFIGTQDILILFLISAVFTAMIQSSSVTTGLAVIMTQHQVLSLDNAIPLILGANIGTTATALLASYNMDVDARKTALSHLLFNVFGMLFFLPWSRSMADYCRDMSPGNALANIHFFVNLATAIIFTALAVPLARLMDNLVKGNHQIELPNIEFPKFPDVAEFKIHQQFLNDKLPVILNFLKDGFNMITLYLESGDRKLLERMRKRNEYMEFLKKELMLYFSLVITKAGSEEESQSVVASLNQYEYLFQIQDTLEDLVKVGQYMEEKYINVHSDIIAHMRSITTSILNVFEAISSNKPQLENELQELSSLLYHKNRPMLELVKDTQRVDIGIFTHYFTYAQRLKDKLTHLHQLQKNGKVL